jgi:histone-arginine methyltransferase CARM1
MLNAYVTARDRFLKPHGRMFPTSARLFVAPFTDVEVHYGWSNWARFWEQTRFFGCNLSALAPYAYAEAFGMPVVGPMTAESVLAPAASHAVDFLTVTHDALAHIQIPFAFEVAAAGTLHGLGTWFVASLSGSTSEELLSTAPDSERTHWYQTRFLFLDPAPVLPGHVLEGTLTATGNRSCSCDVHIEARIEASGYRVDQRYELERHRYWWGKQS